MKIRDAEDGDYAAISRVAQRSDLFVGDLNEDSFPAMLSWLYVQPPPNIRLQFVAEHEDRIVAHYGAVPVLYKLLGRSCIAAFASNLVIDRDHRAGMLFLSLQSHLHREYRTKGFAFAYGLITRAHVLEPHLRTGWKNVGTIPVFAKPFNFPAVASSFLANRALRAVAYAPLKVAESAWHIYWSRTSAAVRVERADAFGPDADEFLEAFMRGRDVTAVRNREILNWRFALYARREYRISIARRAGRVVGYVVTRRMPMQHLDALAVVDIAFNPEDTSAGDALLRACDAAARREGVDVAATIMNAHSPFVPHLRRFGYLKTAESFTLVVHEPKGAPDPIPFRDLFPRWHLTWLEHDYV